MVKNRSTRNKFAREGVPTFLCTLTGPTEHIKSLKEYLEGNVIKNNTVNPLPGTHSHPFLWIVFHYCDKSEQNYICNT